MTEILSYIPSQNIPQDNFFKKLWNSLNQLDKLKFMFLSMGLFIIMGVSTAGVYYTITSHAASSLYSNCIQSPPCVKQGTCPNIAKVPNVNWCKQSTALGINVNVSTGTSPTPTPSTDATVNFSGRNLFNHPVQNGFLSISGAGLTTTLPQMGNYITSANFKQTRFGASLQTIFPTAASATNVVQQDWSQLDNKLNIAKQFGLHPIINLSYSPSWMQPQNQNPPQTNPCISDVKTDPSHIKPVYMVNSVDKGVSTWAKLAATVVSHVDKTFPGISPLYEIWNEPDWNVFLCVFKTDPNPQQTQLQQYKQIYSATVPAIKTQAKNDGVQIQTGGPVLGSVQLHGSFWLSSFVNDTTIAPLINFISYHDYILATTNDTWDTTNSLYGVTQDPTIGAAAQFEQVSQIVRNSKIPYPNTIPIYITEYNTNPNGPDCCKNNPTFAPLWNGLFIADLLRSVFDTTSKFGAAQHVPQAISYFAWNSPPPDGYCMFGLIDSAMDCAFATNLQPYPQYYAYQLFGNSNYLDVTNNGYIVNTTSTHPNVIPAGFFTKTKDTIVLVNAGTNSFKSFSILIKYPGQVKLTSAFLYTLNQANPQIATQTVPVTSLGNYQYKVTISLPSYTIAAMSLSQ